MPESSHKIVVDTSALISLAHGGIIDLILNEFKVVVSDIVLLELKETSKFNDEDGKAASKVLEGAGSMEVRDVLKRGIHEIVTSRMDEGEASCVLLAKEEDIEALISDDFRAMHQLQYFSQKYGFDLGLGAALIQALVFRGKLDKSQALNILERIAFKRGWIGRPIYRAYKQRME